MRIFFLRENWRGEREKSAFDVFFVLDFYLLDSQPLVLIVLVYIVEFFVNKSIDNALNHGIFNIESPAAANFPFEISFEDIDLANFVDK